MLEEAEGLDSTQRRPPPAISHGVRYPPQGVVRGQAPEFFALSITEWAKEGEKTSKADEDNGKYSVITIKAEGEK